MLEVIPMFHAKQPIFLIQSLMSEMHPHSSYTHYLVTKGGAIAIKFENFSEESVHQLHILLVLARRYCETEFNGPSLGISRDILM
jgi:hypothetical protein